MQKDPTTSTSYCSNRSEGARTTIHYACIALHMTTFGQIRTSTSICDWIILQRTNMGINCPSKTELTNSKVERHKSILYMLHLKFKWDSRSHPCIFKKWTPLMYISSHWKQGKRMKVSLFKSECLHVNQFTLWNENKMRLLSNWQKVFP